MILKFMRYSTLIVFVSALAVSSCMSESELQRVTREMLEGFVSGGYKRAYDCRPEEFKKYVSFRVYENHVQDVSSQVSISKISIGDEYFSNDHAVVNFSYIASLQGVETRFSDKVVWLLEDEGNTCVESGFDFFYTLNLPIRKGP